MSAPPERDPRVGRTRALLEREGVTAEVGVAGREKEIVAVQASTEMLGTLQRLAPEIRSLGFRYVALELTGHAD